MKKMFFKGFLLVSFLLLAGCSPEQSVDESVTATPAVSKKSVENTAQSKINRLQKMFEADPSQKGLVQEVYRIAIDTRNLAAFSWAIERGAKQRLKRLDLIALSAMGEEWRDLILKKYPESLPVFMSEAFNRSDVPFFNAHIAALNADRKGIKTYFDEKEFNMRCCRFLSSLLKVAISKKDATQVALLVSYLPPVNAVKAVDSRIDGAMLRLGRYVFDELKDEALAVKLVELGYDYGLVDIAGAGFGSDFNEALMAHPASAIQLMGLHQPGPKLTLRDMRVIIKFPVEKMTNLHSQYVDEAIQLCMDKGVEVGIKKFIHLRSLQRPLQKDDYNELMNWALRFNDQKTYAFLKLKGGDLEPEDIDLSALASNQKMFERYAPKRLEHIEYTFNKEAKGDAITLTEIYEIFGNKNQQAGLFVVEKYDLVAAWEGASQDRTLLMDVCRAGNLEVAKYLIERRRVNLEAETRSSDNKASLYGSSVPTEGKLNAMFFAAQSGNIKLIKYLNSKGLSVNARSNFSATPLMHAVSFGQLDATKVLIDLGAEVNVKMDASVRRYVREGRYSFDQLSSAYIRAKVTSNSEILAVLVKAGATPSI